MWLNDIRIVLPDGIIERGALRMEEGCIADVVEGSAPVQAPSLAGLTALPGLIDIHGDMFEREVNPRPKAEMPVDLALHELDKRLVATGITTAYAAISFAWYQDHATRSDARARELIGTVNALRPQLLADHYVHARFEIRNPEAGLVLQDLLHQDQVHLISIMDHTPGQGQYRDIERYVKNITAWRKEYTDANASEEDAWQRVREEQARPKGWDAVRAVANIAREHRVPLASHDDDTEEKVRFLAEMGVTTSEFPVTEEAAGAAKEHGMHVAMGAPNAFRGGSLSGNLNAAAAVESGLVDTLASDYYPATMLHAAFAFADRGVMPLHEAVKLVSQNPADAMNLHDRGCIETGRRADLVLVEPGERLRVRATIRNGVPVYWDRRMAELTSDQRVGV